MKQILFLLVTIHFLYAFDADIIAPLSKPEDTNRLKADLGKMLFTDNLLSKDGTISCSSCHPGDVYGVDFRPKAVGIDGQVGHINTPTSFHTKFSLAQFHDGRAKDLREQAAGPMTNPIEMGASLDEIVKYVQNSVNYQIYFNKLYSDGVTLDNIIDALVEFQEALVTPARFDRYLKGDKDALNQDEKKGYELFKSYGCIACHNGIAIGGNLFQKLGVFQEYEGTSLGRYNVTLDERDKNYFKVPTLRNITEMTPYLHDGSIPILSEVIAFMGEYQLGTTISDEDIQYIIYFLRTLTGVIPDVVKN